MTRSLRTALFHGMSAALAIAFLFPLLWVLLNSLKTKDEANQQPPSWFPHSLSLANYRNLTTFDQGITTYLTNSVLVSVFTVIGSVVVCVLGGYGFARFTFRGKNLLFGTTLAILMVPYATLLIPLYVLLGHIGLRNSLVGVALVLTLYQLPFAMFMMRISFEAVPREIEEAAMVDGCGTFGVLRRIMLYAVWPGLITVGLFAFLAAWNDFFAPLILVSDSTKAPLPLAIANLRQQTMGAIDFGATQAGVVVMAVPCLLLFVLLQRHYVRGFMSGAVGK